MSYQQSWIFDEAHVAFALKGRQIGFSDGTAGRIVRKGFLQRRPQIFISAAQNLADELIDTVRAHCEVLAALGMPAAVDFTVDNTEELAWRSGGRVIALSSSARTGRSFHGDVYFDEFAFHQDGAAIWKAAAPMATREGWQLRVITTPNGAQGLTYEWVTHPPPGWSLHRVSIHDAAAAGMPVDFARLLELVGGDERVFAEAYELAFLDANMQYVPTALADRARDWKGAMPSLAGAELYAGLDVARTHDLTALVIVAVVAGVAWVVAVLTCRRTAFRVQKKMVRDARRAFGWSKLCVDESGLGKQLCEELLEEFGADEVEPVTFTLQSKEDLATRALRWFRDGRVRFPRGDEGAALHAETTAVRRIVTKAGNVKYDVPRGALRKAAKTGVQYGHGDRFWGLGLALKGAGEPVPFRGAVDEPLLLVG